MIIIEMNDASELQKGKIQNLISSTRKTVVSWTQKDVVPCSDLVLMTRHDLQKMTFVELDNEDQL